MTTHLRADRTVFRFSGPDAHKLLNDVITGPIPQAPGPAAWWGLLSPQGKILAEGLAGWAKDAIWVDVHTSVADDFFKRMKLYRLRASVVIEDLRATHRVGWADETVATGVTHSGRIGYRVIDVADEAKGWEVNDNAYLRARIADGIAELGPDFTPDTLFAHDIGMDLLNGIDFTKGCYVGQEVVSRMKHRGTARRRPVIVHGVKGSAPVLANGRDSGTIGMVLNGSAVGILRLDRFGAGVEPSVDGVPVQLELPAWAPYALGQVDAQE